MKEKHKAIAIMFEIVEKLRKEVLNQHMSLTSSLLNLRCPLSY